MSFYAYAPYVGNGSTQTFAVPFTYIQKTDVQVFVNGVQDTTFTWPTTSTVTLTSIPANGAVVVVKRVTPRTANVNFNDASTLTATNLNNNTTQLIYLVQEQLDAAQLSIGVGVDGNWDGKSLKLEAIQDPTSAQHAATKNYVDTQFAATNTTVAANAATASAAATTATTQAGIATTGATTATTQAGIATAAATTASSGATTATTGATTATTQAGIATAAATGLLNGFNSTSVTSLTIGLGAQSLTVQTGKGYGVGHTLTIADSSAPDQHSMTAVVTSYNSATGALVANATNIVGTGTYSAWTITLAATANASTPPQTSDNAAVALVSQSLFSAWGN